MAILFRDDSIVFDGSSVVFVEGDPAECKCCPRVAEYADCESGAKVYVACDAIDCDDPPPILTVFDLSGGQAHDPCQCWQFVQLVTNQPPTEGINWSAQHHETCRECTHACPESACDFPMCEECEIDVSYQTARGCGPCGDCLFNDDGMGEEYEGLLTGGPLTFSGSVDVYRLEVGDGYRSCDEDCGEFVNCDQEDPPQTFCNGTAGVSRTDEDPWTENIELKYDCSNDRWDVNELHWDCDCSGCTGKGWQCQDSEGNDLFVAAYTSGGFSMTCGGPPP